jgi:hypothetical protein
MLWLVAKEIKTYFFKKIFEGNFDIIMHSLVFPLEVGGCYILYT